MRAYLVLFLCFLMNTALFAQTGIGTNTPNASAKLDVYSENKGFLPPRVTLTSASDNTTISNPATGLLIYNTGNNAGLAAGYYFWNGGTWATIATAGGSGSVAAENGTQILASNISISSSTPTDVLSFTLPSAGTWQVISFLRAQGSPGFAGEYGIYDPTGTLVPNSEILAAYGQNASTGTGVISITTTGAATYKIKAWASTGSYSVSTDFNGRSGVTWNKISGNAPMSVINYGDIKTGIQSGDHNGWIKLNGRAKSTLTSTQQAQANALGIGANLPDATNAFLVQNGTTLGSKTGSNTITIAQNQLPNIVPTINIAGSGTLYTSSDGAHTHSYQDAYFAEYNSGGQNNLYGLSASSDYDNSFRWRTSSNSYSTSPSNIATSSDGTHSHTIASHTHTATSSSINGGVAQQTLNITPQSLSVNTFIYLGY